MGYTCIVDLIIKRRSVSIRCDVIEEGSHSKRHVARGKIQDFRERSIKFIRITINVQYDRLFLVNNRSRR